MDQDQTKQPETTISGDRDIPSVAQGSDMSKFGIIGLIGLGMLAIIVVAMDGMNKSEPAPLTRAENVEFKPPPALNDPYIELAAPEPETAPLPINASAARDPLKAQRDYQMQQEAMRMARELQKREEQRLNSAQIIYDSSTDNVPESTASNGVISSASGASSLLGGSGDANLAFASQYANADVETAQATALQNLHALIAQGTMIDGILETAIQSDLPGMIRAIVSEDVFSFDGSHLLIPKGSKLIGRYRSSLARGQSRVFVIWTRLIRHDGVSINIGSFGTDDLGRSGLEGTLDTHFFERFGSSVLLSLIDASIRIGVESVDDDDTSTVALDSGDDFSRAAEIALENSIGIPPTIHIDQGSRIKVFVGKDLDFSKVAGNIPRR